MFWRPVGHSADLSRIRDLPRRSLDPRDSTAAEYWTVVLRRTTPSQCNCKAVYGHCIKQLLPVQGWALQEAREVGGLLGLIGVGQGKTVVDVLLPLVMPGCKTALLLLPPNLKAQFLQRDFPQISEHFFTPNLAAGRYFTPGLPSLHVVSYSELSVAGGTDLIERIRPDLIICDEAHNLKHRTASRTKRFLRHCHKWPETRIVALSGTLTTKSIKDYAHFGQLAFGEQSPLPLHWPTVEEWAGALDPESAHTLAAPPGALACLCEKGEPVRQGFRRRLVDTPGVVATDSSVLGCSLVLQRRELAVPDSIKAVLKASSETWQRPDGSGVDDGPIGERDQAADELQDAMALNALLRQLSCGFYYRWTWPRGEPVELQREWRRIRSAWNKEVRDRLKTARTHMDSPMLLANAAIRWHEGYQHEGKHFPPHHKSDVTWASQYWPEWRDIRYQCEPQTEPVWLDDFMVRDAVKWGREPGIIWYEHTALGDALRAAGVRTYGGGKEDSEQILLERGDRTIAASIKAHGTGKNLQMFDRALVLCAPADGAVWEQMVGRTHRQGQKSDEVSVDIYQHTEVLTDAFKSAINKARYIMETTGTPQKLIYASCVDLGS